MSRARAKLPAVSPRENPEAKKRLTSLWTRLDPLVFDLLERDDRRGFEIMLAFVDVAAMLGCQPAGLPELMAMPPNVINLDAARAWAKRRAEREAGQ
jgi:hypothetical protein